MWLSGQRVHCHAVDYGFTPRARSGHTKDHHKNGTDCLIRVDVLGCSLPGEKDVNMYTKDPLGSIGRVVYCILVTDFYLVLHGLQCRKCILMDYNVYFVVLCGKFVRKRGTFYKHV